MEQKGTGPYKACENTCDTRVHSQCTHTSLTSKEFKPEIKHNYKDLQSESIGLTTDVQLEHL